MGAFQIFWKNIMSKKVNYNTVQRIAPDTMGVVTATSLIGGLEIFGNNGLKADNIVTFRGVGHYAYPT